MFLTAMPNAVWRWLCSMRTGRRVYYCLFFGIAFCAAGEWGGAWLKLPEAAANGARWMGALLLTLGIADLVWLLFNAATRHVQAKRRRRILEREAAAQAQRAEEEAEALTHRAKEETDKLGQEAKALLLGCRAMGTRQLRHVPRSVFEKEWFVNMKRKGFLKSTGFVVARMDGENEAGFELTDKGWEAAKRLAERECE